MMPVTTEKTGFKVIERCVTPRMTPHNRKSTASALCTTQRNGGKTHIIHITTTINLHCTSLHEPNNTFYTMLVEETIQWLALPM